MLSQNQHPSSPSPSIVRATAARRGVLLAAGAVPLALTGCGVLKGGGAGDARSTPGGSDVATGGAGFATADKETAKLGTTAAAGVFPRTIRHAMGETTLKQKPVRVVTLDTGEPDAMLALGVTPVAIAVSEGDPPVPSYLAKQLAGASRIGTIKAPSLEAIAAAKPDLILTSRLRHEKLYAQLSEIAPTVMSIRPGFPWKENLRLYAAAVGAESRLDAIMREYSDKVGTIKAAHGGKRSVSALRFMPGKIRLYGRKSLIGVVLEDCGIPRPKNQAIDELAAEISAENIGQADGDLLLYSSYGTKQATGEAAIVGGRGWQAIPAVRNGHAHRVDDGIWYLGLGPIGAGLILDELLTLLEKK